MYGYGNSMFLATHGILARTASGGGIDPDAQAFITAASITDPTQQSAINQLVVDLKGYNIWTKMKALYPFCGSTASQHKWNLKDPRDLDVAFRLVFSGGWTHSANGATPNGTNAYADTKLVPSTALSSINNVHLSNYSRTQNSSISAHDMGADQNFGTPGVDNSLNLSQYFAAANVKVFMNGAYPNGSAEFNETNTRGLAIGSATSSTSRKLYFNGNLLNTDTNTQITSLPNIGLYLGSGRNALSPFNANYFSSRQIAFSSIGDGLTDTEAANFYTAVQAFQTTLGRSIGTQSVSDADAQAFVTNAGIVDQVEANAINNLVIGLKADGLWTKMSAIYPMVGGTSSTMKYNLKNPLDTDAAFRLVFNGGWTFSSNGALPNGTNGYADTKLVPNTSLTLNNTHLSIYSRTNSQGNFVDIGTNDNATTFLPLFKIYPRDASNKFAITQYSFEASQLLSSTNTDSRGLFLGSRTSSTSSKSFKNGVVQVSVTNANNQTTISKWSMHLGASNNNGTALEFSNRQLAFASIGDGLTDTEATNLYNRVQTFNTALARQV